MSNQQAEKRIYKYATGESIPEGAIYLSTIKQEQIIERTYSDEHGRDIGRVIEPCWLVWHYFLVESPVSL